MNKNQNFRIHDQYFSAWTQDSHVRDSSQNTVMSETNIKNTLKCYENDKNKTNTAKYYKN